jgi:hypothetical protein
MPEILTASNLTIRAESNRWTLCNGRGELSAPVLTVTPGSITYLPAFGTARRLPSAGSLSPDQVALVVVGWATEDSSWHLGLLLTAEAAQARGGRWIGLAQWFEPNGTLAADAGRALADTLGVPLRVAPPPGQADQPGAPAVPAPPLPPELAEASAETVRTTPDKRDTAIAFAQIEAQAAEVPAAPISIALPLDLGEWNVTEDEQGLTFRRSRAWNRAMFLRTLVCITLTPLFGALSVGALISPYAPVQPAWLPMIGLVITAILGLAAFWQVRMLRRGPVTLVDRRTRMLRQTTRAGRRVLVQSPFEGIQHILVSHVVARQQASEAGATRQNLVAEVWVHAYSPRRGYMLLAHSSEIEGWIRSDVPFREQRPLDLTEIDTPGHRAGLLTAQMIGVPAHAEER